jgi:hypothetical protein
MKAIPLLLAILYCASGQAQYQRTQPSFGLRKINALIDSARALKLREMHSGQRDKQAMIFVPTLLSEEVYNTLSLREKFTYNMINPESYWQNCSITFSSWSANQIPARLPIVSDLFTWSERQSHFFAAHRDSVMKFIKIDGQSNHRLGLNDKNVIVMLNAGEMIPFLQKCYRNTRDCQILTVLMLLMDNNHYPPFVQSDLCKKLYVGNRFQISQHALDRNKDNEAYLLGLATNFYNGLSK